MDKQLTRAQKKIIDRLRRGWRLYIPGPGNRSYAMCDPNFAGADIMVRASTIKPLWEAGLLKNETPCRVALTKQLVKQQESPDFPCRESLHAITCGCGSGNRQAYCIDNGGEQDWVCETCGPEQIWGLVTQNDHVMIDREAYDCGIHLVL